MHYPQYVFAINKTYPTITPLIGKPALGQRTGFSLVCNKKKNYFTIAKMLNLTHYNIFKWIFTYCSWTSKNWTHCIAPHRNKCLWRAHENNLHRSVSHTTIVSSLLCLQFEWWFGDQFRPQLKKQPLKAQLDTSPLFVVLVIDCLTYSFNKVCSQENTDSLTLLSV